MIIAANHSVQLSYAVLELLSDKQFLDEIFRWISADERERYQRFVSQKHAHQFLLARALLRSQLSKRVPSILPNEWVFTIDQYGKPRLAEAFSYLNLQFNLSHSENLVVLALGQGCSLGVDVECHNRPVFSMALAKRYFSESEFFDLMKLTEPLQIKRIAQLWTLKESYLKTNGLGVRVPLAKLEFHFNQCGGLAVTISPSWIKSLPAEEISDVHLFRLACVEKEYSLALTIESGKKNAASVGLVDAWAGRTGQSKNLQCELLRRSNA
jgi:4'-phosphopantetheinyl transferase